LESSRPTDDRRVIVVSAQACGIGVVDALVLLAFEQAVDDGTDLIWNDLLETDERRWLVVAAAAVLSVGYSAVLRLLREPRWTERCTP
jgi:hypothetical protein